MSIVGETALAVLLRYLTEKLFTEAINYAKKYISNVSEIERCHLMFKEISTLLQKAEQKRYVDPIVKKWVDDLEDLCYDAEDILESINYEALHRRVEEGNQSRIGKLRGILPMINRKIKDIVTRLEVMIEGRKQLKVFADDLIDLSSSNLDWGRDPGPLPTELVIYGREEEKHTIIEMLFKQDSRIGVIPIVGMGGLGKTTLARYIFNNDNIGQHFDKRAWIYVSKTYDIRRISKAISEAVNSEPCRFDDVNVVKLRVSEALREKKILVVFDDLWNNNYEDWANLKALFNLVATGSKIVVTTRNANVANMVTTVDYKLLKPLSNEDCWKVFCEHAGLDPSNFRYRKIAKSIVKKCSGLPLAAKSIGGVLRYKNTEEQWERVLRDITLNTNEREDQVMAILRTSYFDLPSYLKQCFLYCAILPKEFVEEEVVPIWMGLGLIQGDNAEETGCNYFQHLVARCMFLPAGNLMSGFPLTKRWNALQFSTGSASDKQCFVMHDLVRDLALEISPATRHLCDWNFRAVSVAEKVSLTGNGESIPLRSFLLLIPEHQLDLLSRGIFLVHDIIKKNHLDNLFLKLKYLRVFSLRGYGGSELPESIGELRLLRYLDLSGSNIIKLPKSTTSLYYLEFLILRFCFKLKELPENISNLINLRYLDITNSTKLNVVNAGIEELPEGVKSLTKLRKLSDFIVAEGQRLTCLKNLNNLTGDLRISGLSNVKSVGDARLAQLGEKKLKGLTLMGSKGVSSPIDYDVVEELRPHQALRKLNIALYNGPSCFPSWIVDMVHLTRLSLCSCDKASALPFMGSFPFLEYLSIGEMPALQEIDLSSDSSFLNLKELELYKLNQWRNWKHCNQLRFPLLRKLLLRDCPHLSTVTSWLESMPLLENLEITRCISLTVFLPELPKLRNLLIWFCSSVSCSEKFELQSLEIFKLSFLLATPLFNSDDISFRQQLNYLMFVSDVPASAFASPLLIEKIRNALTRARFLAVDDCFAPVKYARETEKPQWVLESCLMEVGENELEETNAKTVELDHQLLEHLPPWICKSKIIKNLALRKCPFLTTLSPTGHFSETLASIELIGCREVKSIVKTGNVPIGLERLLVRDCPNLEWLVESDPSDIGGVQVLQIAEGCPLLIQKLPDLLGQLRHVSDLEVNGCTNEALVAICKSLSNLRRLSLWHCPGIESFPPVEMTECCLRLLSDVRLCDFPDLTRLSSSRVFRFLVSIGLAKCPVLEILFEDELPPSVRVLAISFCPLVQIMLESRNLHLWQKIPLAASVTLNEQFLVRP